MKVNNPLERHDPSSNGNSGQTGLDSSEAQAGDFTSVPESHPSGSSHNSGHEDSSLTEGEADMTQQRQLLSKLIELENKVSINAKREVRYLPFIGKDI